ncbi:uncharacterized protein MYCFIDRAFT_170590 [Pseudocercospora fijiensis CIRAD86]|uniref:Uncharacterized protein n=1 Tax=Pseudocercospora fijiensis (strain CIRAD86) TaxID=383855 RepID=N1Q880_PSEFD|nr:uncharacterized protein MYCFIDRAFT_170590 [Pseudocercospora fijiensis CIRAD86]EME89065.1 hypothetical protein MYCFIDRAFT_170590 [Pseudocercospora fijiensis CIRAD86]
MRALVRIPWNGESSPGLRTLHALIHHVGHAAAHDIIRLLHVDGVVYFLEQALEAALGRRAAVRGRFVAVKRWVWKSQEYCMDSGKVTRAVGGAAQGRVQHSVSGCQASKWLARAVAVQMAAWTSGNVVLLRSQWKGSWPGKLTDADGRLTVESRINSPIPMRESMRRQLRRGTRVHVMME